MSASAASSRKVEAPGEGDRIFALVDAAMRRAARKVAAENKRLGLPLIVAPSKPAKRRKRAS
jgi:hypothetical protein